MEPSQMMQICQNNICDRYAGWIISMTTVYLNRFSLPFELISYMDTNNIYRDQSDLSDKQSFI